MDGRAVMYRTYYGGRGLLPKQRLFPALAVEC